ncbi:hypothetical protein PMIN02_009769 [Paraphaeosphaeria minitans]
MRVEGFKGPSIYPWKKHKAKGKPVKVMLQQDMTGCSKGTTGQGKPEMVGAITNHVDAGLTKFITKVVYALSLLILDSTAISEIGPFESGIAQNQSINMMNELHHILVTTECLQTIPLPRAYSITISQITWAYLLTPIFRLATPTRWPCSPITVVTFCIFLSTLYTANDLENPFGTEVNNLALENYCEQNVSDVHVVAAISPTNHQRPDPGPTVPAAVSAEPRNARAVELPL